MMDAKRLEEIRARHAAATKGPWRWFGYRNSYQIDLGGANAREVMAFRRWGMSSAQPVFTVNGLLESASDLLKDCDPANPQRARISEVPHPDARFIAASWEDVADLLDEVERLKAVASRLRELAAHDEVCHLVADAERGDPDPERCSVCAHDLEEGSCP